ncbi:hypothetical protein ANN_26337 [Periplaneta americana]|uniref:Uncharacterized protein n=1 Tax=Periplaneta americana TaxID=6978 RepID=A0ABQ8S5X9_PERAM|nr:hypothetical protein ANN_26337 [Periplaneta americana]
MQTFLRRIEVHPVPFSDHDCVLMVLSRIHTAPQIERSYWKLNSKLICDDEVMDEFSSWWETLSVRAGRSKYTDLRKWMYIYKPAIRSFFRNQGIIKAKDRKSKLQFYYNVIYDLYKQQCEGKDVTKHMNTVKTRLRKLQEDLLKGSTVRCHTESTISEEKAALYHITCEKKRGQTKVINSLLLKNNERITSTTLCLKEAERHFTNIFCRENCSPDDQQILLNNIHNTITPDDQLRLEEDISETELKEAILKASSKSSPVPDGQTGRTVEDRRKEHIRLCKYGPYEKSAIALHSADSGHAIEFDNIQIIDKEDNLYRRLVKEAFDIKQYPNNINKARGYNSATHGEVYSKILLRNEKPGLHMYAASPFIRTSGTVSRSLFRIL